MEAETVEAVEAETVEEEAEVARVYQVCESLKPKWIDFANKFAPVQVNSHSSSPGRAPP